MPPKAPAVPVKKAVSKSKSPAKSKSPVKILFKKAAPKEEIKK
jgi:hypothetical protein